MKHIILFSILASLAISPLGAASITQGQALEVAQQFMSQRQAHRMPSQAASPLHLVCKGQAASGCVDYYVFNRGSGAGFVVVSGDDRALPVLGYSTDGAFDADSVPENMRWWLEGYQQQIEWLRNHPDAAPRQAQQLTSSVAPLLDTRWNQGAPYNNLCPAIEGTSSGRAWTGCVATATAQIMKYHRWPNRGRASHSYYWSGGADGPIELSADFSQSQYQWDDMANLYGYDGYGTIYSRESVNEEWDYATQAQQDAISQLMSDVGIALNMNYGAGGSGTGSHYVLPALRAYFDYDASMQYLVRTDYENNGGDWDALMRSELDAARPIYYSGSNSNAGHAFVFDGYDTNGYFHINWGWGGSSDGYFASTVLNPSDQGAGSSEGGYNSGQMAVIGIQPATEPTACLSLVRDVEAQADVMPANDVRAIAEFEAVGGDFNDYVMLWVTTPELQVLDYQYMLVELKEGEKKTFTYRSTIDANEGDVCYLVLHNPYYWDYGYIWGGMASFVVGDWVTPPDVTGDVTGDGKVDVSDVNAVINIILGNKTEADYPGNADLTGEGKTDVSDVNAIINIILKH